MTSATLVSFFFVSPCLRGEKRIKPEYDLLMAPDDLHALKDDMNAFILGHGLRKFNAYVPEDMHGVLWDSSANPDSWKDFVELAKASGTGFLTYNDDALEKEDVDFLIERLQNGDITLDDELEEARILRTNAGKLGFIQLGFSHQGTLFLYEVSTPWYDSYQQLLESSEDYGAILLDESDEEL